jgi:hypothetical protein
VATVVTMFTLLSGNIMIHYCVKYYDLGIQGLWYCHAVDSTMAHTMFVEHVGWRRRYHRDIDCIPDCVQLFALPNDAESHGAPYHTSKVVVRAAWDVTEYDSSWIVIDDYASRDNPPNPLAYLRFSR